MKKLQEHWYDFKMTDWSTMSTAQQRLSIIKWRLLGKTFTENCHYCDKPLGTEDFHDEHNLFPIGNNEDNTDRTYDWDKSLCDVCYDEHCTDYDIQPLSTNAYVTEELIARWNEENSDEL
jgi:hypothetical protein